MNLNPVVNQSLLLAVRASFVAKGTSMAAWCAEAKIDRAAARLALLGALNGPKAKETRRLIVEAAGLPLGDV